LLQSHTPLARRCFLPLAAATGPRAHSAGCITSPLACQPVPTLILAINLCAAFIVPVNVGFCTGDNPYGSSAKSGCAQVDLLGGKNTLHFKILDGLHESQVVTKY
jgi:hypothetical protein